MLQIIEQTHEEKMTMYMKLSKKELAQMLISANWHLQNMPVQVQPYTPTPGTWDSPIWVIPEQGTVMYDYTFVGTEPTFTVTN